MAPAGPAAPQLQTAARLDATYLQAASVPTTGQHDEPTAERRLPQSADGAERRQVPEWLSQPRHPAAGLLVEPRTGVWLDIRIDAATERLRLDRADGRGGGIDPRERLGRNFVGNDGDQSQPHAVVRFPLLDVAAGQPSQGEGKSLAPAIDDHPPGAIFYADDHSSIAIGEPFDGYLHSDLRYDASHSFAES